MTFNGYIENREREVANRSITGEETERRVVKARKLALKVKPGQLLGDGLVSHADALAINASTEDRAEAYCRWRIAGYVAGEISSL